MSQRRKLADLIGSRIFIRIAVIVAGAAVMILFLSSVIDFSGNNAAVDSEAYAAELKSQLLQIVTHIDGVGEAEIFLTMDNSGENIFLSNSDQKTKSIEPTVRGVVVVCDGGDDPLVVERVLSAVTRSLSISSDKVCITKLSRQ
jgi:stage III sporulation protein AG